MPLKERDVIPMSDPRVAQIGHPAPPWMVNYADLMTELVCFFVVLYSLSAALSKDIQMARENVEKTMKSEHVAGDVKVDKDGMRITLQEQKDNVFFESGSADLSPRFMEILDKIGPSLKKLADEGHEIIVEGHTDDIPLRTNGRYDSNWELSTARATNVVRDLIREQKFPAKQMAAIGYGEYRPVAPNDTPEHRASNRRVVFFVKNSPLKPGDADKEKPKEEASVSDATSPEANASPPEEVPPEDSAANAEPTADESLPLPKEVDNQ